MKMKIKKPLVCVIVLNWNGEKIISQYIESMKKTDYPNYKLIIIDNGSMDKSKEVISKFKNVELVCLNQNIGYTSGFNYGWNYCLKKYSPKYICDMNSDVKVIQKEWLSLMVKELEKSKLRGICSNKTLAPNMFLETQHFDKEKSYLQKDVGQYDWVREVEIVGGTIMLIKNSVIQKIGGLDENFFFGPDDKDYCLRTRKEGFKIIFDGFSKAIHFGSLTGRSSDKNFIYLHQSYGLILYSLRHGTFLDFVKETLTQFLRIIVTKKNSFKGKKLSNLYFHKSFLSRAAIFVKSIFTALKNHKTVKASYSFKDIKKDINPKNTPN